METKSTRVGRYVWDIDIEAMDSSELKALGDVVEFFRAKREREEEVMTELRQLLELAKQNGYHIGYKDDDIYVDLNEAYKHGHLVLENSYDD